jgi:hypothetical protein
MSMDTLRQSLDNQFYAREFNAKIRKGKSYYAISPLTNQHSAVTQFRTRKGSLQAKSERTGKWLGVTVESVCVN